MSTALRRRARLLLLRLVGALARPLVRRAPATPRRVLVIKPDHLGDLLLLTPALRLLRRRADLHITLLIGPWSRAAVAHNPDIDVLLTLPFPGFTRTASAGLLQPYWLLLHSALLVRAGHYDAALIARDDHWWGALLALLAGIPHRIGYALPETRPLLTQALPHCFEQHVTAQSIALVEALLGQPAGEKLALRAPFDAADLMWADAWLRQQGDQPGAAIAAIHPGAGGAAKLWLPARWAEVAAALEARGLRVLLTAGPAERELVMQIAAALHRPPLLLAGEATIGQLTALYSRCTLVLGVDSGPLHLAAAAGPPTLALFGPGDPARFGPWGDPQRQIVLRSGLWCSPCGVLDACPRGTAPSECMTRISATDTLAAIDGLLRLEQR